MTTDERLEQHYMEGARAAWRAMLGECLRGLQLDASETAREAWVAERVDAVAALRRICREHGDLDWTPELHLGDVIEKHLERHLEAPDWIARAGEAAIARGDPTEVCAACSGLLLKGADPRCEDEKLCRACVDSVIAEDLIIKPGESAADHVRRLLAATEDRPGPSGQ